MRSKQLGANKLKPAHHARATLVSHDLKTSHYVFFFSFGGGGPGGLDFGRNKPPRLDKRLLSKHLNSRKAFVHSPITLSSRGSKGLCSPSLDNPITIYKPSFEVEITT